MKRVFLLFLFFSTLYARANDTLTRAQVYNFNVGDTFDYKNIEQGTSGIFPVIIINSFNRVVIEGKFYSSTGDTLFIARKNYTLSANDIFSFTSDDTLLIDGLQAYEIFYDSSLHTSPGPFSASLGYNGIVVNTLNFGQSIDSFQYVISSANGLGIVDKSTTYPTDYHNIFEYDTSLIYYSKGNQSWGTPATIAVGITNLTSQHPLINLFPTINNGQFKINIANANGADCQVAVYDLTGREIIRTTLNNNNNDIEIPYASAGMYLWNVTSQGTILQSGKMVVN